MGWDCPAQAGRQEKEVCCFLQAMKVLNPTYKVSARFRYCGAFLTWIEGESSGMDSMESIGLPALRGRASRDSSSEAVSNSLAALYRLVPFPNGSGVVALPLSSCSNSVILPAASCVRFSFPFPLLVCVGVCAFPFMSSPLIVLSSAPLSLSTEEELIEKRSWPLLGQGRCAN